MSSIASTFSKRTIRGRRWSTYDSRPLKVCALPPLLSLEFRTSSCLTWPGFARDMSLQLVPSMSRSTPFTWQQPGPCSQHSAWAAPMSWMSVKMQGASGAFKALCQSKGGGSASPDSRARTLAIAGSASTEEAWTHFRFSTSFSQEKTCSSLKLAPHSSKSWFKAAMTQAGPSEPVHMEPHVKVAEPQLDLLGAMHLQSFRFSLATAKSQEPSIKGWLEISRLAASLWHLLTSSASRLGLARKTRPCSFDIAPHTNTTKNLFYFSHLSHEGSLYETKQLRNNLPLRHSQVKLAQTQVGLQLRAHVLSWSKVRAGPAVELARLMVRRWIKRDWPTLGQARSSTFQKISFQSCSLPIRCPSLQPNHSQTGAWERWLRSLPLLPRCLPWPLAWSVPLLSRQS